MDQPRLDWITNFIWGIADDVLRDVYVRGKYRDIILPMTVIRRLDAVLEQTKREVLERKRQLDELGIVDQDIPLRAEAGQAFYNISSFTLRDLRSRAKTQQLRADFEAYLDGFSPNVREILEKFEFRNQIPKLVNADILGHLIEKFLDNRINLSPKPTLNADGSVRLPALDNHGVGTIFEELIRRFNEENNEEAGEHFTPRDVVQLMADLILLPIADDLLSGTYLLYDGACGTGGMLTVAEERLTELADEHGKEVSIHLYGQEVNRETYAITKADLLIKGEGADADNFRLGSTLSQDGFPGREFDFMLSNPPYGKSWKSDLERMGGKGNIRDPRFVVEHAGDPEFNLTTRSSDGQLMFLVNKVARMKKDTPLGSRIAEVHNGSSLFTGDAGQGESNIRRWILENDWLEAIIALPLNMFYNTGIATYVWVLTNRKPDHRKGRVQLINATGWFKPLRKNLGKKNCELTAEDISRIVEAFLDFDETEHSKIFPNAAFGYQKVTVERPLRLAVDLSELALADFRKTCAGSGDGALAELVDTVAKKAGPGPHRDWGAFLEAIEGEARRAGVRLLDQRKKLLRTALARRDEDAAPVVKKVHKLGGAEADPLYGRHDATIGDMFSVIEYEPDPELRDTEQVPLLEEGGVEAFVKREVLPHAPDAWIAAGSARVGYEINFNRHFYRPKPLRTLEEIRADIDALERETEGLLEQILVETEDVR
jgi:type I restriction enzyme M protein